MGHFDALARQDLLAIFEPLSCDLIIRHLALENGLVGRLDCQISNVLQHLQLFFCRRVGVGGKKSKGQEFRQECVKSRVGPRLLMATA